MSQHHHTAKELFLQALELPESQRQAFVREQCEGQDSLRDEVLSLLPLSMEREAVLERGLSLSQFPLDQEIAGFQLIRELGSGGMGKVFLAQQQSGVSRKVALKLMRHELAQALPLQRFQSEMQLQALLEHEHIVRVYGGGLTPEGQPFFTMEYVDGLPLDIYCDQNRKSISERLELFLKVGRAVSFAHQHLVVHRDLKPANILITESGVPKLLDFGIAKWLGSDALLHAPPETATHQRLMTPLFAAPEQIQARPAHTTTDVYQLGMVLYLTLVGRYPYALTEQTTKALESAILDQEPIPPSVRVLAVDDAFPLGGRWVKSSEITQSRGQSAAALSRTFRGDLDNIVLKALRKEPKQRYGSVGEMVADIEAYLEGRPVMARPGSWFYRTAKTVRRNRLALSLATLFVGILLFFVYALAQQRDQAEAERLAAEQVTEFITSVFAAPDPYAENNENITASELLERGRVQISSGLTRSPHTEALILATLGHVYGNLGNLEAASPLLEKALELCTRHRLSSVVTGRTLHHLANLRLEQGRFEEAEQLARRGLAQYRDDRDELASKLELMELLGSILLKRGKPQDGAKLLLESLAHKERRWGVEAPDLSGTHTRLGNIYKELGDLSTAEPYFREAVRLSRQTVGQHHPILAQRLNNLGSLLVDKGELEEAATVVGEALAIEEKRLPPEHEEIRRTLNTLSVIYMDNGKYAEAEDLTRDLLSRYERYLGADHPQVAEVLINLGWVYFLRAKWDEAGLIDARAIDGCLRHYGKNHLSTVMAFNNLGLLSMKINDHEQAELLMEECLTIMRAIYDKENWYTAQALSNYADAMRLNGKAAEAELVFREALEVYERTLGHDHYRPKITVALLGLCLEELGDLSGAETLMENGYWDLYRLMPADNSHRRGAVKRLIAFYQNHNNPECARYYQALYPALPENQRVTDKPTDAKATP